MRFWRLKVINYFRKYAILMFDMDLKMPLRKNVLSCFYKRTSWYDPSEFGKHQVIEKFNTNQRLYSQLWLGLVLTKHLTQKLLLSGIGAYSKPSQKSRMEFFAKIVNRWKLLTIFAKRSSNLDVWLGSEYASDNGTSIKRFCSQIVNSRDQCGFFNANIL